MFHRTVVCHLLALALLASALPDVGRAAAQVQTAEERYVSVDVECDEARGGTTPRIEVTIANHSGLPLAVAYLSSFATAEAVGAAGLQGLPLEEPAEQPTIDVENGETVTLRAPWLGPRPRASHPVMIALVVTSAGAFIPACEDPQAQRLTFDGPVGTVAEETIESATVAAEMIGQLEAWHAYPALYAILHPDAQAEASFEKVACWYAAQFGPPQTDETRTIYSTEVLDVEIVEWTWSVSGTTYEGAAEVTYEQTTGVFPDADEPEETEEHLVWHDGVWRWFFGTSPERLADLPDECDLPETT
jgi:hypothetical protein